MCEDCGDSVPASQLIDVAPQGLDLDTVITIVLPILEALHFLHSHDIIHGDGTIPYPSPYSHLTSSPFPYCSLSPLSSLKLNAVNPSCMLYNPSTKTAKLYDFSSSVAVSHTLHKYPARPNGTPGFVSAHPWVDTRFDVYSIGIFFFHPLYFVSLSLHSNSNIGVSMYNMLTGTMPGVAESAGLLFFHLCLLSFPHFYLSLLTLYTAAPLTLHELSADIPLVISNLVLKAMMPKPNDRYQSIYGLMVLRGRRGRGEGREIGDK